MNAFEMIARCFENQWRGLDPEIKETIQERYRLGLMSSFSSRRVASMGYARVFHIWAVELEGIITNLISVKD